MKGSRPLSDEEVRLRAKSFHGVYAARNKVMFILGVRTGFRISEILGLRVGDVYQQGKGSDRVGVSHRHMKGETQRALGHKNINATVSYLSFREEKIDAAILAA
jgi:site-specific recombinase XerD